MDLALFLFRIREGNQLIFEDGDSVLLRVVDLSEVVFGEIEQLGEERCSVFFRSVLSETGVEVSELFFDDGVGEFIGEVFEDEVEVLLAGDPGVADHFVECAPDHGSEERVLDQVQVRLKVFEGDCVD